MLCKRMSLLCISSSVIVLISFQFFYVLFECFPAGVRIKNTAIHTYAEFEVVALEDAFEVFR